MKKSQENANAVEEQNIAIIDYSAKQAAPISQSSYRKLSRGWFYPYECLKYQIETERKRESLRCGLRKT